MRRGSRHPSCLALLRMGVAWPSRLPGPPVVSYTAFSPLPPAICHPWRRFVSVALSIGLPRPGVTRHPTLGSPDFPRAFLM